MPNRTSPSSIPFSILTFFSSPSLYPKNICEEDREKVVVPDTDSPLNVHRLPSFWKVTDISPAFIDKRPSLSAYCMAFSPDGSKKPNESVRSRNPPSSGNDTYSFVFWPFTSVWMTNTLSFFSRSDTPAGLNHETAIGEGNCSFKARPPIGKTKNSKSRLEVVASAFFNLLCSIFSPIHNYVGHQTPVVPVQAYYQNPTTPSSWQHWHFSPHPA